MRRLRYSAFLILLLLLFALLSASSMNVLAAPAVQTTPEPPAGDELSWSTPINLSQSGVAFAPAMVVDESGTVHAVWQESGVDNLLYAQLTEAGWSDASPVEFPFGTRAYYPGLASDESAPLFSPWLISTADGQIHAFWRDEEQAMYHSSVDAESFQEFSAWTERGLVADGVIQIDAVVGEDETLHLAYVRGTTTAERSAGIYYQQSTDGGSNWSAPELLYASRYFRNLSSENAHVSVAAGADDGVFVSWDSPPRERVFMARSPDGGQSWDEPRVVDARQPDDAIDGEGPGGLRVATTGGTTHAIWWASHETAICNVYHQWSTEGEDSWESNSEPVVQLGTCPEQSEVLAGAGDSLFLLLVGEVQTYLLLWNGERWSDLEAQAPLTSFTNPETYRTVDFNWHSASVLAGNRLLVLGRDGGERADVWVMSRPLGTVEEWFPPPSPWGEPTRVAAGETRREGLSLVAGAEGLVHAFWSQAQVTEESEESEAEAVYYARWANGRWSQPFPVLTPASGRVRQLTVTLSAAGRLYVFWTEETGQIYFSRANAQEAQTPIEWAEPRMLPDVHTAARSPSVAVDETGQVFVAYVVPLNEARGVYLMRSEDEGATWSEPVTIFDAVSAEWPMVDYPHLKVLRDGGLHLMWTQFSLPPDASPLSLHYARSEDGGESWSESQLVMEGAVKWSAVAGLGERVLHRVWKVQHEEGNRFWYDMSLDGGRTWARAERLAVFDASGSASLASDGVSQLHLLHLSPSGLGHQWWNGEFWEDAGRVELGRSQERDQMAAGVIPQIAQDDGRLFVVYSGHLVDDPEEEGEFGLFAVDRGVEIPNQTPMPLAAVTPTSTPVPEPTGAAQPQATPTPAVTFPAGDQNGQGLNIPGADNAVGGLIVGLLPVGLLVLAVIIYGLRATRFGRGQ